MPVVDPQQKRLKELAKPWIVATGARIIVNKKTGETNPEFKCIFVLANGNQCGKTAKEADLVRHFGFRHSAEKPEYKCGDCGATFARAQNLKNHKNAEHSDGDGNKCPFCDVAVADVPQHISIRHKTELGPWKKLKEDVRDFKIANAASKLTGDCPFDGCAADGIELYFHIQRSHRAQLTAWTKAHNDKLEAAAKVFFSNGVAEIKRDPAAAIERVRRTGHMIDVTGLRVAADEGEFRAALAVAAAAAAPAAPRVAAAVGDADGEDGDDDNTSNSSSSEFFDEDDDEEEEEDDDDELDWSASDASLGDDAPLRVLTDDLAAEVEYEGEEVEEDADEEEEEEGDDDDQQDAAAAAAAAAAAVLDEPEEEQDVVIGIPVNKDFTMRLTVPAAIRDEYFQCVSTNDEDGQRDADADADAQGLRRLAFYVPVEIPAASNFPFQMRQLPRESILTYVLDNSATRDASSGAVGELPARPSAIFSLKKLLAEEHFGLRMLSHAADRRTLTRAVNREIARRDDYRADFFLETAQLAYQTAHRPRETLVAELARVERHLRQLRGPDPRYRRADRARQRFSVQPMWLNYSEMWWRLFFPAHLVDETLRVFATNGVPRHNEMDMDALLVQLCHNHFPELGRIAPLLRSTAFAAIHGTFRLEPYAYNLDKIIKVCHVLGYYLEATILADKPDFDCDAYAAALANSDSDDDDDFCDSDWSTFTAESNDPCRHKPKFHARCAILFETKDFWWTPAADNRAPLVPVRMHGHTRAEALHDHELIRREVVDVFKTNCAALLEDALEWHMARHRAVRRRFNRDFVDESAAAAARPSARAAGEASDDDDDDDDDLDNLDDAAATANQVHDDLGGDDDVTESQLCSLGSLPDLVLGGWPSSDFAEMKKYEQNKRKQNGTYDDDTDEHDENTKKREVVTYVLG